jgi:phage gpG-like protein
VNHDLEEVEKLAGALLRSLSAAERRRALRRVSRALQKSQRDRIARQKNPDGSAFADRKERQEPRRGNHAVKFLYPKGSSEPRLVTMKSWVHDGPLLTGFDIEAGGMRSFFWDKVDSWLPVSAEEQNKGAGKLRRNGHIRRKAMFRKLRGPNILKAGSTDTEAWIGFAGQASRVATIHQEGGMDRPSLKSKPVRYAKRSILGVTEADRTRILDLLFEQLASG